MRPDKLGWYHWRAQRQDDMRNRFPEKEGRDADQK